jgi:hypothetical protein
MAAWSDFEKESPELAAAGRKLLYQFGPGLGYLATVRRDGGPRLHPICPILFEGRLYALITASPKRGDLRRDGRYALHSFPSPDVDDEFYVTGYAAERDDAELAARVRAAFTATGATSTHDETLFELDLEHVLLSTYKKRGEPDAFPPRYSKWHQG